MNYVFPSDQDRAENQQLDEACDYIEYLLDQKNNVDSVGVIESIDPMSCTAVIKWKPEQNGEIPREIDNIGAKIYTQPQSAGVPECLREHLERIVKLHNEKGVVLTADIDHLQGLLTTTPQPAGESFQSRVSPWTQECFGSEISEDTVERNHRFLEESLELVQSLGCTAEESHQLVDYVFGRPVGDPPQEVGGVRVTLSALCLAAELNEERCAETELARIWTKVPEIRAKQASKPKHSPLPQSTDNWYCSSCGMKREIDQCNGQQDDDCHYVQRPISPHEQEK